MSASSPRGTLASLAEAHPAAAAVLIDEVDAGLFKRAPNDVECCMAGLTSSRFKLMHRHEANTRFCREILLAPTD
jgi:hypothetical protein